jgi:hypothetical protein
MEKFMGLLNPWLLIGALGLGIPILVHLVRNDKSERIRFSSLMFLLRIPKQTIRQRILRNPLLMALRLLLLALLVLAFARPYLEQAAEAVVTGDDGRGVVFLVDNSYSMSYGTNLERARAEVVERVNGLSPDDRAALVTFSDRAQVLGTPSNDFAEVRAMVSTIEPTPSATAFYEAFIMADRVLAGFEGMNRELVVISDFQRNGWNRSSRESVIDGDVEVELVNLGVENPANVGFESVNVDATVFTRTYEGQMLARLNNYDLLAPATVNVSLDINDRTVDTREVTIDAESSELVEFTGFELPLGYTRGRVRIDDDDPLMTDNEFLFTTLRRDRLGMLIMDTGASGQSHFLEVVFEAAPDLPFAVERQAIQNVTPAELEDYDVVIINDVPRLSDAMRSALDETRAAGQGQLIFLGDNADPGWWNTYEALPVTMDGPVFVQSDRDKDFYSLTTWERSHPIFTALESDGTRFTLSTAQFFAFSGLTEKDGAAEVGSFEDGSAALVERAPAPGEGNLLVIGSTADSRWNDWPSKPTFLAFIHEAVRYLAGYQETRAQYQLGEAVSVPESEEATAAVTPDGERISLSDGDGAGLRFFTPEQVGIYELRIGPDTVLVAVNPPASESQLDAMIPDDLLASVRRLEGEARRAALGPEAAATDGNARRQNWWWYLFLFALLAGIGEIYLGNRITQSNRAAAPTARAESTV